VRRNAGALLAALLATVVAGWAIASLWWPFQSDHGVYAWMADVVLRGGMPYRDAWDVKGPTAIVPSLLAELVFGRNVWGIRALDLILVGATAVGLFRVARRWMPWAAATITALGWVLLYARVGFGGTAQPDGFWGMLLLLSLVPSLRGTQPSGRALALAGACVGGMTLLKPIYIAFLALPLLAALPFRPDERPLRRLLPALAAGFFLPIILILGWLWGGGALPAFLDAYIAFNAAKNGPGIVGGFLATLSDGVPGDPVWLVLLAAASAGFVLLRPGDRRTAAVLIAWIAVALVVAHLQRPYYSYRAHVLSPPVALLAGHGLARAIAAGGAGRALGAGVAAALLLLVGRPPLAHAARWALQVPGPGSGDALLGSFHFLSTTAAGERRLIRTVSGRSAAGERIFAFRHPAVYFLADRRAASRLSILAAFGADAPADYITRHLDELGRALETSPPRIIALPDEGSADACFACFDPLSRMPATAAALAPRYRLLQRADGFVVFVRSDSAPSDQL
jgi:hypothetical protein